MHKRFQIAVYLALTATLLDQATKWFIINQVVPPQRGVVVNAFFNLVLIENRGITFGLLSRFNPSVTLYFLLFMAGTILFFLGRWLWRTHSMLVAVGLGFIIGGAIGNVIDRLRYGAVIDFLDFHIGEYHWYSFNLADSAIVIGITLLLMDTIIRGR